MTKSNLLKSREKTITTNLSIGFTDFTSLTAGNTESGAPIYTIPRQGAAMFKRMLWTFHLEQDPVDVAIVFAILDHAGDDASLETSEVGLVQRSLFNARQQWRVLTAVGVVDTAKTIDIDMEELNITRRSNLQSDNESSISPAYRANANVSVGMSGVMSIVEKLFQRIDRDDPTEWAGYTFEESAS